MFQTIRKMLEMIRFSHTVFALPFALLAAAMAWAAPVPEGFSVGFRVLDLVGILICMVGARSAGMAFNRLGRSLHRRRRTLELLNATFLQASFRSLRWLPLPSSRHWFSSAALVCFCQTTCHWRSRCRCWEFCLATAIRNDSLRWLTFGWGWHSCCRRFVLGWRFAGWSWLPIRSTFCRRRCWGWRSCFGWLALTSFTLVRTSNTTGKSSSTAFRYASGSPEHCGWRHFVTPLTVLALICLPFAEKLGRSGSGLGVGLLVDHRARCRFIDIRTCNCFG